MLKKAVLKIFWKTKYNRRLISELDERMEYNRQRLLSELDERMKGNRQLTSRLTDLENKFQALEKKTKKSK